jgi:microcin C transport system substrate-binding protein
MAMKNPIRTLIASSAVALALVACGEQTTVSSVEDGKAAWEVGKASLICKQGNILDRVKFPAHDNTEEVQAYYADNPEVFVFKTLADLPEGLTWENSMELPEIGSDDAIKGGTYNERVQDFPRTLRLVGPDSNGSFRPFILDYVRMSWANPHPGTKEFKLFPGIAKEWALSPDEAKVYVRINPEARYSDGTPITADDAFFTFFMMRSKYIVAPWYNDNFTNILTGITKFDDLTFAVHLSDARPDMAYKALNWDPYPEHFFKELGDDYVERYQWQFVPTSGPYVVCPEDLKKGRAITIRRINDWWAADNKFYKNRYNYDRVRFTVIRDTPKAFEAFRKGELDRFSLRQSEYWYDKLPDNDSDVSAGYIHKSKFINVHPRPTYGLWMNESKPLISNHDIRVGINYASNWEMVAERYYRGDATRMRTTADGYGPMSHPTLTARPYDPEKAREYFAKAGFTVMGDDGILRNEAGEKLSVSLSTGYENLADILTILREEALKAGLELRLEILDGTSGWKKVQEKKHDIHFSAFGVGYEMYPRYWETNFSTNAYDVPFLEDGSVNPDRKVKVQTNNLQVIANAEIDKMILQYRTSENLDEMYDLMVRLEEALYEDASFVPGFVLPFYRVGHHRWFRYPEGFNEMHTSSDIEFFVGWVDEEMKKETKAAKKSGETFETQINVYDQFKDD